MLLDHDRLPPGGRRRWLTAVVLITTLAMATAVIVIRVRPRRGPAHPPPIASTAPDPAGLVARYLDGLDPDGPYRDPDREERSRLLSAARLLVEAPDDLESQRRAFGDLGFDVIHGADPETGRPFSLFAMAATDEPAWGMLLVDRSAPPSVVVEVPHPRFDIDTDALGLGIHRQVAGSVLLIAGAHRDAAGGRADVAHNDGSAFHALATEFARSGLAQVQVHGYATRNLPEAEVVVSTGAGPTTQLARDMATALERAGLVVCRAWRSECGQLEGTRNEQGRAADEIGVDFLHLEFGWVIRHDEARRATAARAVAAELRSR